MKLRRLLPTVLFCLAPSGAWMDAATDDLHGYARAVSLDVRGVVPSADELSAIELSGSVSPELLDDWLASDAFVETVLDQHRTRFWNVLELTLLNSRRITRRSGIYFVSARARALRGAANIHCGDFEADVDEHNRPITWTVNEDGTISEGWVWVAPYWAPTAPVKVCALDAQDVAVSDFGVDCSVEQAQRDPTCGCGPELQWCMPPAVENEIESALERDIELRVVDLLNREAPYSELFVGGQVFVNGRSAHFFRHLAPFRTSDYESPVPVQDLPDIDFLDDSFHGVPLASHHAGVLTAPVWLLRHQTNRGRANRFYGGFLCSEFVPTQTELEPDATSELPTPDLMVRSGCMDCHARLEPWAAYWGRWSQAGARHLAPADYPEFSAECAACVGVGADCPDECEDHYISEISHPDEEPYLGTMWSYAFLDERHQDHPDSGPAAWVDAAVADGGLARCAVESTADWLLAGPPLEEDRQLWEESFQRDLDYRDLVRQILLSQSYWGGNQ